MNVINLQTAGRPVESWHWRRHGSCVLKREGCSWRAFQTTWCNDPTCQTTRRQRLGCTGFPKI